MKGAVAASPSRLASRASTVSDSRGWGNLPTSCLAGKSRYAVARMSEFVRDRIALCHQVTTLDRAKLVGRLGELPAASLARVNDGLRAALAL
jgi:hypothetical protein